MHNKTLCFLLACFFSIFTLTELAAAVTNSSPLTAIPAKSNTTMRTRAHSRHAMQSVTNRIKLQANNYTVWESFMVLTNNAGNVVVKTNRFTELGTGLNYLENGTWKRSRAEIEITNNGAMGVHGPHKVFFDANINDPIALSIKMPNGEDLKSHILGLAYFDFKLNKMALIAQLQDSIGQLVSSNQILYTNAFDNIKADVLYTYTKAGLEQDIILRQRPPDPMSFGFNYQSTRLQVYTEFSDPPAPTVDRRIKQNWKKATIDHKINFESMSFGHGKAFGFGNRQGKKAGANIDKHWITIQDRTFLVEEVPLINVIEELSMLPQQASVRRSWFHIGKPAIIEAYGDIVDQAYRASNHRAPRQKTKRRIMLASLPKDEKGLVLDYTITGFEYNFIFQGDTTYYVPGDNMFMALGSTTIEGGAVIKYGPNSQIMAENVNCMTEMYHPAVFTALDDLTMGTPLATEDDTQLIVLPSGAPTGYYAAPALSLDGPCDLHDLRFEYADTAIEMTVPNYFTITHCQFLNCNTAIRTAGQQVYVGNVLMSQVQTGISGTFFSATIEHLTFDQGTQLADDPQYSYEQDCTAQPSSTVSLVNSIITGVASNGIVPLFYDPANVVFLSTNTGVFASTMNGYYYLPQNSSYRQIGNQWTSVSSDILKRTTQPPLEMPLWATITGTLTLNPQTPRDTSAAPDLGYHYDPLDYTISVLYVSNGVVNILPGTAIGLRDDPDPLIAGDYDYGGFCLMEGSSLAAGGWPTNQSKFADVRFVEEGPYLAYQASYWFDPINNFPWFAWMTSIVIEDMYAPQGYLDYSGNPMNTAGLAPPNISMRFCNTYLDQYGNIMWAGSNGWDDSPSDEMISALSLSVQDCNLHEGTFQIGPPIWDYEDNVLNSFTPGDYPAPSSQVSLLNNLFDRVTTVLVPTDLDYAPPIGVNMNLVAYNNLFRQGMFSIQPYAGTSPTWTVMDNVFDQVSVYQDATQPLVFDHNAYFAGNYNSVFGRYTYKLYPTSTPEGATDGLNDQDLANPLPYQYGPLGYYYMDPSSSLFGSGSRSPSDAGLFHYTTRNDQIKEGSEASGHMVNIGLHYVATDAYLSTHVRDTDGDGIPDYVENWHGDGVYANHTTEETDWQNQYTVTGIFDPTNAVYDDIDLSGNGIVGRIKRALGMSALDMTSPLTLCAVPTGTNPDLVTYEVPVNYQLLTNIGILTFSINGVEPPMYNVIQSSNGNCCIEWNKAFNQPGNCIITPMLTIFGSSGSGTATTPSLVRLSSQGSCALFNNTNALFFDIFYAGYTTYGWLHAQLENNTDTSYTIQIIDANNNIIRTVNGDTSTGNIHEYWDGNDDNGNPYSGKTATARFTITPSAGQSDALTPSVSQSETHDEPMTCQAAVSDGTFSVACANDYKNPAAVPNFRNAIETGVVQPLINGQSLYGFETPDYVSFLNSPIGPDMYWDGFWTSEAAVSDLYYHLGTGYTEDCRNFFFEGHGSPTMLSDNKSTNETTPSFTFYAGQLAIVTGNRMTREGGFHQETPHPYRFVFLDACDTATLNAWPWAFGIIPQTLTWQQAADRPDQVQAFVGWVGEPRCPSTSSEWDDYGDTLFFIFDMWREDEPLITILRQASNNDPLGDGSVTLNFPFGEKFGFYSGNGRQYIIPGEPDVNNFHYKILGYPGITRTGYE